MARNERFGREREPKDDYIKKTVSINRVAKVVKGGKNMHYSALVVVGDGKNRVGCGLGKAREVPDAIEKANKDAIRNMVGISIVNETIPHATKGVFERGAVLMFPAEPGTGVIAGGAVRAVIEATGIKDIRTKSIGSGNPINTVKATIAGLKSVKTAEEYARIRGIDSDRM